MANQNTWRYAAVVSSLLLAGTYVWWSWRRENIAAAEEVNPATLSNNQQAAPKVWITPVVPEPLKPISAGQQSGEMTSSKWGSVRTLPPPSPKNLIVPSQPPPTGPIATQPVSMPALISIGDGKVSPVEDRQLKMEDATSEETTTRPSPPQTRPSSKPNSK